MTISHRLRDGAGRSRLDRRPYIAETYGPALGGRVRLVVTRYRQYPDKWSRLRGTVVGADLRTNTALVEWDGQPGIVNRFPYAWLVEVNS